MTSTVQTCSARSATSPPPPFQIRCLKDRNSLLQPGGVSIGYCGYRELTKRNLQNQGSEFGHSLFQDQCSFLPPSLNFEQVIKLFYVAEERFPLPEICCIVVTFLVACCCCSCIVSSIGRVEVSSSSEMSIPPPPPPSLSDAAASIFMPPKLSRPDLELSEEGIVDS